MKRTTTFFTQKALRKSIFISLFAFALLFTTISHAQVAQDDNGEATTNDGPTGPGGGPGDPDVPIDGGISILIAAGIGYGLKKKYDFKRKDRAQASI